MRKFLSVFFAILIVVSSVMLAYTFVATPRQNYANMLETIEAEASTQAPVVTDTEPEQTASLPMFTAFEGLKEENADTAGWLKLSETYQFPVVQNNELDMYNKYLSTDFDGAKSKAGTLYFSSDVEADSDVAIIYGHNMRDGSMFGCLPLYRNLSYVKANPTFELARTTDDGVINRYKIVAVCSVSVNYDANDFYYPQAKYSSEEEFNNFVEKIKAHSFFTMDDFQYGDKVVILNTCAYGFETERTIVVGVLDNTSDINTDSYGINSERVTPIP